MRSAGTFTPTDLAAVTREVTGVLRSWEVRGGAPALWASSAATHVDGPGEWVLEYDLDLSLVSFEVFHRERRVFGIDDWLA